MATTPGSIARLIIKTFQNGNKVIICGNGGSASLSDHLATELLSKFKKIRKPLPAISLTNSTVTTAIGNDFGFEYIFSRQIEALGRKGDVLLTMSTSGTSANILAAIEAGKNLGLRVINFPTNKDLKEETDGSQEIHLHMIQQSLQMKTEEQ